MTIDENEKAAFSPQNDCPSDGPTDKGEIEVPGLKAAKLSEGVLPDSQSMSIPSDSFGIQENTTVESCSDELGHSSTTEILAAVNLQLQEIQASVKMLQEQMQSLVRQQEFLQKGVRHLGGRVTDAASSLGAPRVRELFMRLLLLYDLVAPTPAGSSDEVSSLCNLIATQIEQFLQVNGFERIQTDSCVFDSQIHKPVQVEVVHDPGLDGRVLRTFQNGFQSSQQTVLRPAAVLIGRLAKEPSLQAEVGSEGQIDSKDMTPQIDTNRDKT